MINPRLMELLNVIGIFASVLGLLVSIYTLYKVNKLPIAMKQHSRDKQLSDAIDKILRIPASKQNLVDSNIRDVESIVRTVRLYYVSRMPFRQHKLKSLLSTLEQEIASEKQVSVVQSYPQAHSHRHNHQVNHGPIRPHHSRHTSKNR